MLSLAVQLGVQAWMFTNIEGMCDSEQKDGFICPSTAVFGTASIIWGVIGPARQFSHGQIYYGMFFVFFFSSVLPDPCVALTFFFLIGFICPVIAWLISLKWPNSVIRYIKYALLLHFGIFSQSFSSFPVIFSGTGLIPPASAINYVPWAIVGFIFQYVIRRRHFAWWTKYNYVLSAAMDAGVAISAVLIFFCLQYPRNGTIGLNTIQAWWGNTVYTKTADWNRTPVISLAENGTFGPATW
jgi:hypothetical protein